MHLRSTFEPVIRFANTVRAWFLAHTVKDTGIVLFIIMLAVLLRVPFLSHPNQTLFDEVLHANFAINIIAGAPFFDIHPPLARMLFAEVASFFPFEVSTIPIAINQSFQDFPYVALRFFVALFGILLVPLVYALARTLGYIPRIAMIPALFVVFDNALVFYSRTMLPDTILLVCVFSGFLAAFAATKKTAGWKRYALVITAALALGLAVSIKWTALGVVGVVFIAYLLAKMYREIFISGIIVAIVYTAIFTVFLFSFPGGGKTDPVLKTYDVPIVTELEFPGEHRPGSIASFFFAHHRVMLETNRDPEITKGITSAPGPLAWPPARSVIAVWKNSEGNKFIILTGNSLLWIVTFFALIFELIWIAAHYFRDRRFPIDRNESILLLGYLMNYLPFFLIHRPMFLYHYFTSLIFLFLLFPRIAPRIVNCIARVSGDRMLALTLAAFVGLLILVNFILLAPSTYGF
ncbi:MAG: hypothetical protein A2942_01195 [Candidatus Lloydbacteria bacterium RIFCSPLOWO2_01_FULL_50_20]|uniref:Polyprenol-phosphate-mannose--protein mannosyltransferase n=1 Tax=Candidatus Lloydbacteria bacterium RIFCSPLOWO2_01_FULL_50_20 TaxID=1798665 RepID=A0A1G2DIV9_9BACT|nr:MAG: hypothetical protein A3C13_00740 [Candidatus Lloydbacteria bacterium RIFCSPHIGHO2_02_FULL_50_11]OGZ13443.1 MAG: hypothetical protein A2942_01195 [Candidatus Lloydbacteria bacterium RIFCSPLOWO2_01_FULL_50_20]